MQSSSKYVTQARNILGFPSNIVSETVQLSVNPTDYLVHFIQLFLIGISPFYFHFLNLIDFAMNEIHFMA